MNQDETKGIVLQWLYIGVVFSIPVGSEFIYLVLVAGC